MYFNEEEKKIFEENEYSLKDPFSEVRQELIQSFNYPKEDEERIQIIYNYVKRILVEVAKKRGIDIDPEASFNLEYLLSTNKKININISDFKDADALQQIIQNKVKNLSPEETREILSKLAGDKGSISAEIRILMEPYINRINDTIMDLDKEISSTDEEKKEESIEDETYLDDDELDFSFDDDDFEGDIDDDGFDGPFNKSKVEKVSNEELINFIKYINTWPELMQVKTNSVEVYNNLSRKMLQNYKDNNKFYSEFKKIIKQDESKNNYLFHGTTTVTDGMSILKQGLGMFSKDLNKTTYSYHEFKDDDALLAYSRGIDGSIGRDAIVVIDQPRDENGDLVNIVREVTEDDKLNFSQAGLGGLNGNANYMIDKKYIVGLINKKDMEVVYNDAYYDKDKFSKEKESDRLQTSIKEGVKNALGNVGVEEIKEAEKQIEEREQEEEKDV